MFMGLQNALTSAPILILPDYNKPFTLITDTSDYTTGSILEQDDALGQLHPVTFYSKSLQPAEQNYEIHDKELLAIIHTLKHFCHYLQGSTHQTKIFLDHANLNTLPQNKHSHVAKHAGPYSSELLTTLLSLNLENLIKLMCCPGNLNIIIQLCT